MPKYNNKSLKHVGGGKIKSRREFKRSQNHPPNVNFNAQNHPRNVNFNDFNSIPEEIVVGKQLLLVNNEDNNNINYYSSNDVGIEGDISSNDVEEEEDNSDKNFYEEWHPLRRLLNRNISTTSINKFNNIIIDTSNYSLLEEAYLSYDYNNKALNRSEPIYGGGGGGGSEEDNNNNTMESAESDMNNSTDNDNEKMKSDNGDNNNIEDYDEGDFNLAKSELLDFVNLTVNNILLLSKSSINDEYDQPLYPGCKTSTREYSDIMFQNFAATGATQAERTMWLKTFKRVLPSNAKLPIDDFGKSAVNEISNIEKTKGVMIFDICELGCTVYFGIIRNNKSCTICNTSRYYSCRTCSFKSTCCDHKTEPRLQLQYRCIIPILVGLCMQKGFIDSLHYNHYEYRNGDEEKYITDMSNAQVYREAMNQLNDSFRVAVEQRKSFNNDNSTFVVNERTVFVPILLSIFYDGVQLFKTKTKSLSPFLLTILNLPPSFRKQMCLGKSTMFLSHD